MSQHTQDLLGEMDEIADVSQGDNIELPSTQQVIDNIDQAVAVSQSESSNASQEELFSINQSAVAASCLSGESSGQETVITHDQSKVGNLGQSDASLPHQEDLQTKALEKDQSTSLSRTETNFSQPGMTENEHARMTNTPDLVGNDMSQSGLTSDNKDEQSKTDIPPTESIASLPENLQKVRNKETSEGSISSTVAPSSGSSDRLEENAREPPCKKICTNLPSIVEDTLKSEVIRKEGSEMENVGKEGLEIENVVGNEPITSKEVEKESVESRVKGQHGKDSEEEVMEYADYG